MIKNEITPEIYRILESIVGKQYISNDLTICQGYRSGPSGYEAGAGYERIMTKLPACVIMPESTEQVQKIVKICVRYNIAYVPWSTGFYGPRSHPHEDNELLIDMKRMTYFEIDERHLYAVVGPGVIYSQLQEEAFKRGCYVVVGGGGAQVSVLANMISDGWSPLSYRIGLPNRRILGTEYISPEGEITKMGSVAYGDDWFWGEGPGPDLRGMLRGYTGVLGCLGIVTRIALKLLPFQPEKLEPTGITPNTALALPPKRVKWINFTLKDEKSLPASMLDIEHAEICAASTKVPLFWRALAKAKDKEEFWELWSKENEESVASFFVLRVLLVAFTSEEQMEYEEKVLMEIMSRYGAVPRQTKPSDESWFKNADSAGMWLLTGSYVSVDYIMEALDHAIKQGKSYAELKKGYTPPLMPDYGDPGWFQSIECGHMGYSEFLVYWDQFEDTKPVDRFYVDSAKMNIKGRFYTSLLGPHQPLGLTGPHFGPDYHKWMLAFKEEFDPNWKCHPPVPLAHDEFVVKAPWMKEIKDWDNPVIDNKLNELREL